MVVNFARLKLRVMANSFRGQRWRVVFYVLGCLMGLWFAFVAFTVMTLSGLADEPRYTTMVPAIGGATLVLGWLFIPLVWAGVDETLDPARFALLPLPRRTLVAGLLVAALLGIPALATLLASTGLVVGAAQVGGVAAALAQGVGIVLGLLVCVAVSRAVTSAFATLLRARRTRDVAAVALALLAALLGPLQIAVIASAQRADVNQMVRLTEVIGWTPLAAPYMVGMDVAHGSYQAALARGLIAVATIGTLLWWWSRSLESAMLGAAASSGSRRMHSAVPSAVDQLYPRLLRWLPRSQEGALVAREARYWWRDARRRASMITIVVLAVFVPLMGNLGQLIMPEAAGSTAIPVGTVLFMMMTIGSLAAVTLANQFGFDGTAYGAHLVIGVPGRVELRARVVAFSVYLVPLLIAAAVVAAVVLDRGALMPALIGGVLAVYGTGVAANLILSIIGAYALPETSNPFAINTGAGVAKSLLALLSLIAALALAAPVVVAALLLDAERSWLLLPVGAGYGLGAVLLGLVIAGDILDRRAPELLVAVTPRR